MPEAALTDHDARTITTVSFLRRLDDGGLFLGLASAGQGCPDGETMMLLLPPAAAGQIGLGDGLDAVLERISRVGALTTATVDPAHGARVWRSPAWEVLACLVVVRAILSSKPGPSAAAALNTLAPRIAASLAPVAANIAAHHDMRAVTLTLDALVEACRDIERGQDDGASISRWLRGLVHDGKVSEQALLLAMDVVAPVAGAAAAARAVDATQAVADLITDPDTDPLAALAARICAATDGTIDDGAGEKALKAPRQALRSVLAGRSRWVDATFI